MIHAWGERIEFHKLCNLARCKREDQKAVRGNGLIITKNLERTGNSQENCDTNREYNSTFPSFIATKQVASFSSWYASHAHHTRILDHHSCPLLCNRLTFFFMFDLVASIPFVFCLRYLITHTYFAFGHCCLLISNLLL